MVNQNAINRSVSKANTNMKRVNVLAEQELRSVLRVTSEMTFDEQAKFVRSTTPIVIQKYGNVASTVAATHYNEYRGLVAPTLELPKYRAVARPAVDFTERINNLLDISIAKTITSGVSAMQDFIANSASGILSEYNRSTMTYNSENETVDVVELQRVAAADACAFCAEMAIVAGNIEGLVQADDVYSFEPDYHDNCSCTLEVIYAGQKNIRPEHYDTYENIYNLAYNKLSVDGYAAAAEAGTTRSNAFLRANPQYSITTKNIAAEMRAIGGLR